MDDQTAKHESDTQERGVKSPPAEGTKESSASKALGFLPDWLRSPLGAALTALVAVLGFWISPVKDWVFHKIWRESAQVELRLSTDKVGEGDEFQVSVVIVPQSIALSAGTIFVDYSEDTLQLRGPGNVISVPTIKDPSPASTLTFRGEKHGPASVHIRLNTRYGSYEAGNNFMVFELGDQTHPTKFNLTGTWNFRMDQHNGELHVRDQGGAISGTYELDTGDVGSLKGVRGPAAFEVSLISNKKHLNYAVECSLNLQDEYIELKGDATPDATAQPGHLKFYASSRT
jgi:hypothetical protein